jgi:hypothetical protein
MKRFLTAALAVLLVFAFCACAKTEEVIVQDGMKLAGVQAGNKAVEYSFTYPEEWEIIRNDGVIEIQLDCDDSQATAVYATLTVLSFGLKDASQLAKPYWEEYELQLKGLYKDYKLLDTKEYDTAENYLHDAPALKVKYTGTLNGINYFNEQIICCRGGSVYLITLVVPNEYAERVDGVMKTVKENFKFN